MSVKLGPRPGMIPFISLGSLGVPLLYTAFLVLILFLPQTLAAPALLSPFSPLSNDEGLGDGPSFDRSVSLELVPDHVQSFPASGLTLQIVRKKGQLPLSVSDLSFEMIRESAPQKPMLRKTDAFGKISVDCPLGERVWFGAQLENSFFEVVQDAGKEGNPYGLRFEAQCGTALRLEFDESSEGGQALGIWQVAMGAVRKLEQNVELGFWNKKLKILWPASSDSYSHGEIRVKRGDYWDVVGHELGHAIYDFGQMGKWGNGSHKIEKCYTEELALSEGWATFFSGWLNLDLKAEDPRFEFLAPRFAPLPIETVPSKVCLGVTNEWRVAAFFWDLMDSHRDNELLETPFKVLWNAMNRGNFRSMDQVRVSLIRNGVSASSLDGVWYINFYKH